MPPVADISRSPIGCTTENPSPSKFNTWCKKNKVSWPKCSTSVSATTGRCVVAQEAIKADEVVVELPDDMVLMAENCDIQDLLEGDGLTKPADDALLEVQGLVIAVMHEKALGSKSKWGPYLSFLPQDLSHMIIYWTDDELEELRGTAAHDKLVGRVQHPADAPTRVRQLFEELVVPFVMSHERVARVMLGGNQDWTKMTEEDIREQLWQPYLWSTAAVASYSFVLGDDHYQGMVAVWDLLNHITGAVNVRLNHDADRGVLQMVATEDIPKGAEVVNCYGTLSNAELLRGYGYVEQHNSIKHVQVPAHFCIKAAAAAAGAAAGATGKAPASKKGREDSKQASAAAGAEDDGVSDRIIDEDGQEADSDSEGPSGSDSGDSDEDDESSEGDDESSSSDGSESEPDWDLEDDSSEELQEQQQRQQQYWAQQQQQQQKGQATDKKAKKKQKLSGKQQQQQQVLTVPSLVEAQAHISDWEERWQLCFSLGLLPKNGVFQVPAGRLSSCPGQLVAVLLLFLLDAADCAALAAALVDATHAAAAAAAAPKHKSSGRKQQHKAEKPGRSKRHRGEGEASGDAAQPEAVVGSNPEEQQLPALKSAAPAQLASALQQLLVLLVSRYTCSLQEDQQLLLQGHDQLPPRQAAAVMARSAEKEVWSELQQGLLEPDAPQELMSRAREALAGALQQAARKAAESAGTKHDCCRVPGCEHEHHHHEGQQQQQGQRGGKGGCGGQDGSAACHEAGGEEKRSSKRSKRGNGSMAGAAGNDQSEGAAAAKGFSFNFDL